jgi:N utilization substance protein A
MSELSNAIKQICEEKGLSYDAVIETIESALSAAYRKDFGQKNQNIKVEFDPETMNSEVYDVKTVVEDLPEEELAELEAKESAKEEKEEKKEEKKDKKEEKKEDKKEEGVAEEEEEKKFNPKTDLQISDAKLIKEAVNVGDELKIKLDAPSDYGRMAAQTAKQVIIQRLREAEREMVFNDFKDKEHEVVSGTVQRREGRMILVDLGRSVGIIPPEEQIYGEKYQAGDRVKVYVKEVNLKPKGPEIILSRTSEEILKKVFYLEIPEIANGLIEIKSAAREAGSRSKIAVSTDEENVDPIGSCVGQRGARIQTIISELGGEKVDIIEYDEEPSKFITNALSPAKIVSIKIYEEEQRAEVLVAEDQLSLAIGKGGQNARLAAKLTGWKIDIIQADENGEEVPGEKVEATPDLEIDEKEEDKKGEESKEEESKEDEEKTEE